MRLCGFGRKLLLLSLEAARMAGWQLCAGRKKMGFFQRGRPYRALIGRPLTRCCTSTNESGAIGWVSLLSVNSSTSSGWSSWFMASDCNGNISSESRRFDSVPGEQFSPEKSYIFAFFAFFASHTYHHFLSGTYLLIFWLQFSHYLSCSPCFE